MHIYNNHTKSRFTWDKIKRVKNLGKHHLDFADVALVLDSQLRLDIESVRNLALT